MSAWGEWGSCGDPGRGAAFGLGGQDASQGYGIMPGRGGRPGADEVADAVDALPEDLRRHLGL